MLTVQIACRVQLVTAFSECFINIASAAHLSGLASVFEAPAGCCSGHCDLHYEAFIVHQVLSDVCSAGTRATSACCTCAAFVMCHETTLGLCKVPDKAVLWYTGLLRWLRRSGHRHSSTLQTTRCCLRACCSSLPWSPQELTLARRYCISAAAFLVALFALYRQHHVNWLALNLGSVRCALLEHGVLYCSV